MQFFHGVRTRQARTSISTPVVAASGITFAVGTAPVHMVNGKVNEAIYCGNEPEAAGAFGYSDDWKKYSLCEVVYSHFKLFQIAPVIFVNVLDPARHRQAVEPKAYPVADMQVRLPLEAIKDSVKIENYTMGEDYDAFYDGDQDALIVEILSGGAITSSATELTIGYDAVDPSAVTKSDIIGGFNLATKKVTGFELIDTVFPRFGLIPDILICPGWSHDAEVAAIMTAKAANINEIFEGKALIDVNTTEVRHYTEVPAWKRAQNLFNKRQIVLFPMCGLAERIFHKSTQAAGLIARVDINNGGAPSESPSNKSLQMDRAVLADGTEVILDVPQANFLNANGIATSLNFSSGFTFWGNETACFPGNTDIKDFFIPVSRMFGWISNSLILTYWNQVDRKMSRRFIESIVDSINIWLNGLMSEEHLLGGRVEFHEHENPLTALMSGRAVFRVLITPPSPAREIEFILQYSTDYVMSALAA
jgi:phage tail sheath protein FI